MRTSRHAARIGLLLWLLTPAILAIQLDAALDSVVQITAYFTVRGPGGEEKVYVSQGSGWTSACRRTSAGYQVTVGTAAHVVDPVESLRLAGLVGSFGLVGVHYEVDYRDGSRYRVPRDAFRRGTEDSATLRFPSPVPRPALPAGDPKKVGPGDRLFTLACPQGLRFLAADGVFSATLAQAGIGESVPPEWRDRWWLSTLPAAPGSSGAPVLNGQGQVVAHIVGRLEWPGGTLSILQPREVKP